jgi:hypothetical protein
VCSLSGQRYLLRWNAGRDSPAETGFLAHEESEHEHRGVSYGGRGVPGWFDHGPRIVHGGIQGADVRGE